MRIVQTDDSIATGSLIADAEAWDDVCDIPLIKPLDPALGKFVIAVQSLCGVDSPEFGAARSAHLPLHHIGTAAGASRPRASFGVWGAWSESQASIPVHGSRST